MSTPRHTSDRRAAPAASRAALVEHGLLALLLGGIGGTALVAASELAPLLSSAW